jgi:hypothetical protein
MTDEERQLMADVELSDPKEDWSVLGIVGTVVLLLFWAWLMVVFLSAAFS